MVDHHAFLRPVEKPTAPLTAIDTAAGRPLPIDAVVVLQRLPEVTRKALSGKKS